MNFEDDFGFSLVSEQELKQHEELLRKKVEEQSKMVAQTTQELQNKAKTTEELQNKVEGLRKMIMPLLLNLAKDPDKTYVLWPDRAQKVQAFIKKLNDYVDNG